MSTINISLPDEMQHWIENEVKRGGFRSADEFFHQLVHNAKAGKEAEELAARQVQLEALLLEGLESRPEIADEAWWAQLRADMEAEFMQGGRSRNT